MTGKKKGKNMKLVTFNIRCVYRDKDGINSFIHRVGGIYDKLRAEKPDVVAFQEIREQHLALLEPLFPDYLFVGHLREADYSGEGVYTAVRRDTCQLLGSDMIWLSPTPYTPGSRFEEQSPCPRILQCLTLRYKQSGQVFRLFNLHLDHISEQARVLGMQAALAYLSRKEAERPLPYAIVGDFNAYPDSETIALCNGRADMRDVTAHIPVSFHDFGRRTPGEKIDYIFLSNELADRTASVTAWEDVEDGIYLSDHYPLSAEMAL